MPRSWARMAFLVAAVCFCFLPGMVAAGEPSVASLERPISDDERAHWSFQNVRRPPVPTVRDREWPITPVDSFILARLESEGLKPAQPADRRALLRRAYLDLIGLPPTLAEQERFLADRSPAGWARLIDDLLARPQYGERWGRHWLDVVRYAETNGYERDGNKPHAWRYRDYVIESLNRDKPFNRFAIEQLAGDELPGSEAPEQIATTFLRLGTWDDEPADPDIDRCEQLDDVLGTTCLTFLGMTVQCARCHEHKFEPFTQVDYSRLLAIFEPLKRPQKGRQDLDRMVGKATELAHFESQAKASEKRMSQARAELDSARRGVRDRLMRERQAKLPPEVQAALACTPEKRDPAQKKLVEELEGAIAREIDAQARADERAKMQRWSAELAKARSAYPNEPPRAYIWFEDSPTAPGAKVLVRGDPTRPAGEVGPDVPVVLRQLPFPKPKPAAHSTGRRLALAEWIASPKNPLTARVIVNRVWKHHFGEGIVSTENDFGIMGDSPSHPELLDWLASEFMANGWRLKPLHRLLMLSRVYQMSSQFNDNSARVDAVERLHWRRRPTRLEAEVVRDAALSIAGELNLAMAGPSVFPPIPRAVLEGQSMPGQGWAKSDAAGIRRRSIYIFVKRAVRPPELDLLDFPDTTMSCEQRPVSTVAPQALTMMNGDFFAARAAAWAKRLLRERPDALGRIDLAFRLAYGRAPEPAEKTLAAEFLSRRSAPNDSKPKLDSSRAQEAALAEMCLVLLNANEFVYSP